MPSRPPSCRAVADIGPTPLVVLEGAELHYGPDRVLGPYTLSLSKGEIVAIVGASGAGKSSLLRLLAGLETAVGHSDRRIAPGLTGFVFQSPTLMPWADARTNTALPLELRGLGRDEALERADKALAEVGLADHSRKRPHALSGGMAMRVALARAVVTDPVLLLLDEPFAALDSVTRRRLMEQLHSLWEARRPAVVFVTHDVEEAVFLAQRVIVLGPGGKTFRTHETPGPLPRPPNWRADPGFRARVETVAADLAAAMDRGPGAGVP